MNNRQKALDITVIRRGFEKNPRLGSKFKDIGGFEMNFNEFKEQCLEAWSEKFNYLRFDMTERTSTLITLYCEERNF